jgi:hypothetical protein
MKLQFVSPPGKSDVCFAPAPEVSPVPEISEAPWMTGRIETPVGDIPVVNTRLLPSDKLGTWKARWGIRRMRYTVPPGLYAVGSPTAESPVLASANYKMSFDRLRSELAGLDAWILVLDTKGINVWCAAGKGTFGTEELVRRLSGMEEVVSHRRVIVPQLGAPGVSAHELKKRSGFRIVYGPIRASDIRDFLAEGMKATDDMRRVRFPVGDRVALIPMEMIPGLKYTLPFAAVLFLLSGVSGQGWSLAAMAGTGTVSVLLLLAAFLGGTVVSPALLPWIPGRAFSVKGALTGAVLFALAYVGMGPEYLTGFTAAGWALLIPAVSSFYAMNFTGASTYTSLSGVRQEMKVAVPLQAAGALLGLGLWSAGLFV